MSYGFKSPEDIIDKLLKKLNSHPHDTNNSKAEYQNFNNFYNFSQKNPNRPENIKVNNNNNNINNNFDYQNEYNIRRLIKEEFEKLITNYQKNMYDNINNLEYKINNLEFKVSDMSMTMNNKFKTFNNNMENSINYNNRINHIRSNSQDDNINKILPSQFEKNNYDKRLLEIEFQLKQYEEFFKGFKEVLKNNEDNVRRSMVKTNNEIENKFNDLEYKIHNKLNLFYNNNLLQKISEQIKNNENDINILDQEIKKIKIDINYSNDKMKNFVEINNGLKKDILQLNDEIKKNKGDIEIVRAEHKNNIEIIDKKIFNLNLLVNNNKNEKNIKESRFAEIEEINEAQFEKESNNINI